MLDGSPWGKSSPTILAILCSVAPLSALAMNLSQKKSGPCCASRVSRMQRPGSGACFHYTPPGFPCIGHSEANNEPFEIDGTTWARARLVTVKDYRPRPGRTRLTGVCAHIRWNSSTRQGSTSVSGVPRQRVAHGPEEGFVLGAGAFPATQGHQHDQVHHVGQGRLRPRREHILDHQQ